MQDYSNCDFTNSTANLMVLIALLERAQDRISSELLNHFPDDDIRNTVRLLQASQKIDEAIEVLIRIE